jgi:hypothetical protein
MIGTRLLVPAVVAILLVPLIGQGGPDPSVAIGARRLVVERAEEADAALAALERAVAPGLDAARRGSAMVVTGTEAPGAELRAAASALTSASGAAGQADAAVRRLEGARRAAGVGSPVALAASPAEVESIAAQLEGTAGAADAFAAMRRRAEGLLAGLDGALAALDSGSLAEARDLVARARADHDAVAGGDVELVTLPIWIETSDAMIAAVETIIAATEGGDEDAAVQAANEFASLAEDAAPADRALRIAIGEGGNAVTAAPMGRLADLLREVAETRLVVASILRTVER